MYLLLYVIGLFVYQAYPENSVGRKEQEFRGGKLVSVTSSYNTACEEKMDNSWEMNGSEMKRAVKTTQTVRISKSAKVDVVGNCQRSRTLSTAVAENKMKTTVTDIAKKNTKKRKHGEIKKTSDVIFDTHPAVPAKRKTENSSTEKCTDSLRTGKVGRKVRDVQCKRMKAMHKGSSPSSSFHTTKKSSRKVTGSHDADGKEAGNCSEMKKKVVDTRKKTRKEQQKALSCADYSVTMSSDKNRLPAATMAYRQGEGEVCSSKVKDDNAQTLLESPLPCTGIEDTTLRSGMRRNRCTSGSTVCKRGSRNVCSELKTDAAKTAKETKNKRKYTRKCSNIGVTPRRHRTTNQLATGIAMCKQAGTIVCSNSGSVEIGKEVVKVQKGQLPCSDFVTPALHGADHLVSDESLCVFDFTEINNNIDDTRKEIFKKHKGTSASSCNSMLLQSNHNPLGAAALNQHASTADDFAEKSDVSANISSTLKECEGVSPCMNFDRTLQPCDTESRDTEAAAVCQKMTSVVHTSCTEFGLSQRNDTVRKRSYDDKVSSSLFHMTLRPQRQRQDYNVIAGRKSRTASDPVSNKLPAKRSEVKCCKSKKHCCSGSPTHRCSKS